MSKVYVLLHAIDADTTKIEGIITNKKVADVWAASYDQAREEFELDDPELLNRIAKEGEKK